MRIGAVLRTFTRGDPVGRLKALRSAGGAVEIAVVGSALDTGVLTELLTTPLSTEALAARRHWDHRLLTAYLEVLAAHRLVRRRGDRWEAAPRGRRVVADDVVQAVYRAFSDYHTGLYRDIEPLLAGVLRRDDVERRGELIARLSRAWEEFVLAELRHQVRDLPSGRLLDVGCGAGAHLVGVLEAAPTMTAVGVETDAAAADLARRAVQDAGLGRRAEVVHDDVGGFLSSRQEWYDVILLANVVYYVPVEDRAALLGRLAARLTRGGRLVVVTTVLTDDPFSRHFDLLLRGQQGEMGLPTVDGLSGQLREADLVVDVPRRIAPREPLTVLVGRPRS